MRSALLIVLMSLVAAPAVAADTVMEIARSVAERRANEGRVGTMVFKMVNKAGRTRNRTALMAHAENADMTKVAIYFTAPAAIEETAFLSYDRPGDAPDENWLYLPATQKVRRLPPSDRGDYFLGTDLTYGDIKDNFKFPLEDWTFTSATSESVGGKQYHRLKGTTASPARAKELGYRSFSARIDPKTWFPTEVVFTDADGALLKTVRVEAIEKVGGAWTAMKFSVEQHQSGHKTFVHF
ncbi:MAG: outer membrane lipoprotein-sorting protein, partial [Pseudomonadota bacterium]